MSFEHSSFWSVVAQRLIRRAATPNHALQRTAPVLSCLLLPAARHAGVTPALRGRQCSFCMGGRTMSGLARGGSAASRGWLSNHRTLFARFWFHAFCSPETPRDGRGVALAQDAIDLADVLGIPTFAAVGHDWGARAAYTLAALYPARVLSVVGIALAYQPRARFQVPAFSQARGFWYQWFMALDQGAEAVRKDPTGFARIQWNTWSPSGWFDNAEFEATAESFRNPDWTEITLNAYSGRWRHEPGDPRYDDLQRHLESVETLDRPTLMIQGGSDFCDEPATSEGMERFFSASYRRLL